MLWNYETLNGGWNRLNYEIQAKFRQTRPCMINTDWSEFDMRVYFTVWKDILDKVKTYFCFCGKYCPTRTYPNPSTRPSRLNNLWNWITSGYFTMLCVSPLGRVFRRLWAGMPSGIFCTQFFDSFYNGLMIVCCLRALDFPVDDDLFLKLMGDDALFALFTLVSPDELPSFLVQLSEEAFRRFGSKLSAEKCKTSPSPFGATALGYKNWNGWPTRDEEELLARLLYPKSTRDMPDLLMARSIGIAFAACGNKRIIQVCKHIYDHLDNLGIKPNSKGLASMYDPLGIRLSNDDLLRFPIYTELICRISKPSARNPEIQSRYWDLDHFSLDTGLAHECPIA